MYDEVRIEKIKQIKQEKCSFLFFFLEIQDVSISILYIIWPNTMNTAFSKTGHQHLSCRTFWKYYTAFFLLPPHPISR